MQMRKNKLSGFAMIELIMSMGLISLVLLSLLGYQISIIKNCFQIHLKTIAINQLINFSEMLLTNTSDSQRTAAFSAWNTTNKKLLPQGEGQFMKIAADQCQITVNWFCRKEETETMIAFC